MERVFRQVYQQGWPRHDTFGKALAALVPDAFERRIQRWVHTLPGSTSQGRHVSVDGKTLRQSFDRASGQAAIHMISAYVHENHALFGQLKVDDKTNEITAIPQLLDTTQNRHNRFHAIALLKPLRMLD